MHLSITMIHSMENKSPSKKIKEKLFNMVLSPKTIIWNHYENNEQQRKLNGKFKQKRINWKEMKEVQLKYDIFQFSRKWRQEDQVKREKSELKWTKKEYREHTLDGKCYTVTDQRSFLTSLSTSFWTHVFSSSFSISLVLCVLTVHCSFLNIKIYFRR